MNHSFLPVLVAEDEESDAVILRLAFQKAHVPHPLVIVHDGQEAVDYLLGKGHYADRILHPIPALILLDLKMPRMSGFDVLAWLQTQT
jgi:CheY-like chemotaxis protein